MATNGTFAERLTELREIEGKKRQEVADSLGITRASLEYYEKGKRKPDIEVLTKLANYYKVSTDYLLGLSDVQTTDKDIKFICEYTGLDEFALCVLREMQSMGSCSPMRAVNNLFVSGEILKIANIITTYYNNVIKQLDYLNGAVEYKKNNDAVHEVFFYEHYEICKDYTNLALFKLQEEIKDFVKFERKDEIAKIRELEKEYENQNKGGD